VYIANCATLLSNLSLTIRAALTLAYTGDADEDAIAQLADVAALETRDDFANFIGARVGKDEFIFIFDQYHALDPTHVDSNQSAPESDAGLKFEVSRWLDGIRGMHMSILGVSPNPARALQISSSRMQAGCKRLDLYGGLSMKSDPEGGVVSELAAWRTHFGDGLPEMGPDEDARMLFLTGCVPLYLHALLDVTKEVAAGKPAGASDLEAQQADDAAEAETQKQTHMPLFRDVWPSVVRRFLLPQEENITRFSSQLVHTPRWADYLEFILNLNLNLNAIFELELTRFITRTPANLRNVKKAAARKRENQQDGLAFPLRSLDRLSATSSSVMCALSAASMAISAAVCALAGSSSCSMRSSSASSLSLARRNSASNCGSAGQSFARPAQKSNQTSLAPAAPSRASLHFPSTASPPCLTIVTFM
jgi:hypothetical protein